MKMVHFLMSRFSEWRTSVLFANWKLCYQALSPKSPISFSEESYAFAVDEKVCLNGIATISEGMLGQVAIQIDGYSPTEDYIYAAVDISELNLNSYTLGEQFVLDGTLEPLNNPGEYVIKLLASETGGVLRELDRAAVTVTKKVLSPEELENAGLYTYGYYTSWDKRSGAGPEKGIYVTPSPAFAITLLY